MAVQKSKPTRSKRGMRRSHHILKKPTLTFNKTSNEIHLRHNISKKGYYKQKKIIK